MNELTRKIQRHIHDLPTLPTSLDALSEVMNDPEATVERAARIISADQASAFKVLRYINSAHFGIPRRVESISRAIVILGFAEVRNLIMTSAVIDSFSGLEDSVGFRPSELWSHSIGVGVLSRMIGREAGLSDQADYFISGILHDVGKLVLYMAAKDEFCRAQELAQSQGRLIRETELEVIGMDHAWAGALLAERWRVPRSLRNAIRFHHTGLVAGNPTPLVAAVHLADVVARMLELGHPGDDLVPPLNSRIWEVLPLPEGTFRKLVPSVLRRHHEAVAALLEPRSDSGEWAAGSGE